MLAIPQFQESDAMKPYGEKTSGVYGLSSSSGAFYVLL